MSVLFIAVPVALALAAGALAGCVWCIRMGQYEDLETPAVRMLFDEAGIRASTPSSDKEIESKC